MIRLQDNISENYINQSRDFQMFTRLYDCVNNGVRYDIDSMIYIFDPMLAKGRILKLLAARVGFFPTRELDDMMLRYIITAFPIALKYKGTRKGISICIDTILKARNIQAGYSIIINNEDYTINIEIKEDFDNIALEEFLRYIIPTGYITTLAVAEGQIFTTSVEQVSIVSTYVDPNSSVSQVATELDNYLLPTYSINIELDANGNPVAYAKAGLPNIESFEGDNETTVKYTYYEKDDDGFIHKKEMTLIIPYIDNNRYNNTLLRSEVIGSNNDGLYMSQFNYNGAYTETTSSYVKSADGKMQKWSGDTDTIDLTTGHDKVDNPTLWPEKIGNARVHITKVFNDLLEQSGNRSAIFNVVDNTSLYDFENDNLEGFIETRLVDITEGFDLDNAIANIDFPPYILDSYGSLAQIIRKAIHEININDTKVEKECFDYKVISIGVKPKEEEEEEGEENNG